MEPIAIPAVQSAPPPETAAGSPTPAVHPSPMPAVSMDGALAEVTSAMSRWLDRKPDTREERAAQVVDLLDRDALLPRRPAGEKARRKVPWLIRTPFLPWVLFALLAYAGWRLWQADTRKDGELAAARSEVTLVQFTLAMQGLEIRDAQATAAAQETAMAYDARRILGPMSGALVHDRDGYVEAFPLTVSLRDFDLSVRFDNPYDSGLHPWDFGIMFRNIGASGSYRLMVLSTGIWKFTYGALPGTLASGTVENLNGGADMQNELLLQVAGDRASFSVNGVQVSELDVSAHPDAGSISIATGLWQGDEQSGETTRFEDLRIWGSP